MQGKKADKKVDSTDVVKCKTCGADMYFDIASGKLRCPYCDNTVEAKANVFENEHNVDGFDESKLRHEDGVITYQCPNCHAKCEMHGVFDTSAKCPFCGATNVLKVDDIPGLAPDAILPFRITREVASQNALKWIKKKLYAPIKLKKSFKPENLNSVYSPTFSFDSDTFSTYNGRLGEYYTVTVGSGKDRRTETRIRYFNVSGTYSQFFNDVLIEVSPKLSQKEFEKVGGFDTDNAVEYTSEYIAGHSSERYDTSVNDAYGTAKEKMNARIKSAILAQYHYDVVDYIRIDTSFNDSTFKYILVPLWCSGFKYRDKIYNYFVNGRTGRAGGKTPISVWKVALTVVIIAAVIVGAYFGLKSAGII